MKRRAFIRVVGGGAVLAATTGVAGIAGCSSAFPDEALTAWQGPGDEPDLRRWALSYAILAPSSHNRQPWLVDLREPSAITLYVDRERLLPETDPWFRQIMVSQGTFIEALVLALGERGIAAQVALFPQGEFPARQLTDLPVARIHWQTNSDLNQVAPKKDALFAQLLRRHTARIPYDMSRTVNPEVLQDLASVLPDDGEHHKVNYGATVAPERLQPLRELAVAASAVEFGTARTMLESLRLTRVGPAEIARYRDGISINGWMPRLASVLGLYDRSTAPATDSVAYRQTMEQYGALCATAMGFVWLSTPAASVVSGRRGEVAAGRAYMRMQLKASELGVHMHPLSQAPQEFAEMQPHYARLHELLLGKPATSETVQMFCRVGYGADQTHAPRRPLTEFVRA